MTFFRTCQGCVSEGSPCEARDALRLALRGLCVTSVKWKCAVRRPRFEIGSPVWATTIEDPLNPRSENGGAVLDLFPAVVVRVLGGKALVFIKPGAVGQSDNSFFVPTGIGFCKLPLSRLSPRDGERVMVCQRCELPASEGHLGGYSCAYEATQQPFALPRVVLGDDLAAPPDDAA